MEIGNTNNIRENSLSIAEIKIWLVSYLAELLEIEPSQVDTTVSFDRYGLGRVLKVGEMLENTRLTYSASIHDSSSEPVEVI